MGRYRQRSKTPERGKIVCILLFIFCIGVKSEILPADSEEKNQHDFNFKDQTKDIQNVIDAVQCSPEMVRMRSAPCTQYEVKFRETLNYHLLQEVGLVTVPAVRCKVRRTVHSWYCGKYGHLHLAAPAITDLPMLISDRNCEDMHYSKTFNLEGVSIPVFQHRMNSHTLIINGSLTYFEDLIYGVNPGCVGKGLMIENIWIPNTFQEVHVSVQAQLIKVTQHEKGCYLDDEFVGNDCIQDINLRAGSDRVIVPRVEMAHRKYHQKIRTIEVGVAALFSNENVYFSGQEQGRQIQMLFEPHNAFALELKNSENFEHLLTDLTFFRTNIPQLLIWITKSEKAYFPFIQKEEQDFNLQLKLAFSFLKYKNLLLQRDECYNEKTAIGDSVKFHRFQVSRFLGEIELISPCQNIAVAIFEGEKLGCYHHHLSVRINGSIYGISAFARILKNVSGLIPVECSENPVYLRLRDGRFAGNSGDGIHFLQVQDEVFEDSDVHRLYQDRRGDALGEFDMASNEEIELSTLALDASEFSIKVTESWFSSLYHKTVAWFSDTWQNIILIIGAVMVGLAFLVCMSFVYYMTKYTILTFRRVRNNDEHIGLGEINPQ